MNYTKFLLRISNRIVDFASQNVNFSCFARSALAESQQLPDNSEVKPGARGTMEPMLF